MPFNGLREMCIRDSQKVAAEKANESQPRKRSRINVKKDGDKVYTATKDLSLIHISCLGNRGGEHRL